MLTIYEKPTCTTCRQVSAILAEKKIDAKKVNYYIEPLSEKKLKQLINKMKIHPSDLLRSNEAIYKELSLAQKKSSMSEQELISLMVKYPDLVQRPIAETDDKAILARPAERIREIL